MSDKGYNGWTNYATWRVQLEYFDGMDSEFPGKLDTIRELAEAMQESLESLIETEGAGLCLDYAMSFLSDVNWYEIAGAYADNNEFKYDAAGDLIDEEEDE